MISNCRLGRYVCLYDGKRQKGDSWRSHSCHLDGFGGFRSSNSLQILAIPSTEQIPSKFPSSDWLANHSNSTPMGCHFAFGRWFRSFWCLCQNWFKPMVGRPTFGYEDFGCMVDLFDRLCPHSCHDSGKILVRNVRKVLLFTHATFPFIYRLLQIPLLQTSYCPF